MKNFSVWSLSHLEMPCLKPIQLGRSRLRDLGLPKPSKKEATLQHCQKVVIIPAISRSKYGTSCLYDVPITGTYCNARVIDI